MGQYYDEWMCISFEHMEGVKVDVARRRILLIEWAAKRWHGATVAGRSKVWWAPSHLAFTKPFDLRTGCLVTCDGTQDEEIRLIEWG
jgi:hypothetical protein